MKRNISYDLCWVFSFIFLIFLLLISCSSSFCETTLDCSPGFLCKKVAPEGFGECIVKQGRMTPEQESNDVDFPEGKRKKDTFLPSVEDEQDPTLQEIENESNREDARETSIVYEEREEIERRLDIIEERLSFDASEHLYKERDDLEPMVNESVEVDSLRERFVESSLSLKRPNQGDLIINELLVNPAKGLDGDANQDGVRSATADEFIEIVNQTFQPLDLEGVRLIVGTKTLRFSEFVLPARGVVLVFGGGNDRFFNTKQPHPKFDGAYVFSKSISLSNKGKTVVLENVEGRKIDQFIYTSAGRCNGNNVYRSSITLSPDLQKGTCRIHQSVSSQKALFSPGRQANGGSF